MYRHVFELFTKHHCLLFADRYLALQHIHAQVLHEVAALCMIRTAEYFFNHLERLLGLGAKITCFDEFQHAALRAGI